MRRRHLIAATAGFLAMASAVGAASAETISIFSGSSPIFAPAFIADGKGYFSEEGLEVEVKPFTSGAEATEGFRSGGAQFLVAADVPLVYLLAGGDARLVAQFSANGGMLIVLADETVAEPMDLEGKKIGLVRKSASEYVLHRYLRPSGLSLADVELVNLAPFDQVTALVRGDVDALSSWKPFDSKIFQLSDKFRILTDSGSAGYVMLSGIVGRADFLVEDNRPKTEALVRALARASRWLSDTPAAESAKVIAAYLGTDPDDALSVIEKNRWGMEIDPSVMESLSAVSGFLHGSGFVKNDLDWSAVTDWSYLKAVDPSLVALQ